LTYILPLTVFIYRYLHSNFSVELRETIFSARVRFGRSRSPNIKVIDYSTNRKRACDFLLVRHSNLNWSYLSRFQRYCRFLCSWTPPLFHPNFGRVPVGPDRWCWGQPEHLPLLIIRTCMILLSKYSNLWDHGLTVPERHGQTDIRTT